MAERCFIKKGSIPPVCGIHNVRLVQKPLPVELVSAGFKMGEGTFIVCPVNGLAVNDEASPRRNTPP